jgi:hypothetical protein
MVLVVGFLLTLLIPPAQLRGRGPTVAETLTEDASTPPTTAAVIEPSGQPV